MKRNDMELRIQEKLRKQKHMFDTFQKNPDKMSFDCLIGNLCGRVLTEVEKAGMVPPKYDKKLSDDEMDFIGTNEIEYFTGYISVNEWESED